MIKNYQILLMYLFTYIKIQQGMRSTKVFSYNYLKIKYGVLVRFRAPLSLVACCPCIALFEREENTFCFRARARRKYYHVHRQYTGSAHGTRPAFQSHLLVHVEHFVVSVRKVVLKIIPVCS